MDADQVILKFCMAEVNVAAHRVVHKLRRLKPTGIYGDDCGHRTLWDEFCYEVQNGPTSLLHEAWAVTQDVIADDVVQKLPVHLARLMSWHLQSFNTLEPDDAIDADLLKYAVLDATKSLVSERRQCWPS